MMPAPEVIKRAITDLLEGYTGSPQYILRARKLVKILDAEIKAMQELPRSRPAGYSLGDAAALLDQEHHAMIEELLDATLEIRESRKKLKKMLGRKDQGPQSVNWSP